MRSRKQNGTVIRIGDRWYVRYWERRNVGGTIERKRVSHALGPVTTRGKRPPADIVTEAQRQMVTVNSGAIPAERILTIGDFVERVYLPWVEQHKRPSTAKGYRDIWQDHLNPLCGQMWLKDTRTYHVQSWLNQIGSSTLSRNTLKHIKSVVSGIFKLAKQQAYFEGENPARDTAINPRAAEPQETYAYTLEEVQAILAVLPEPAATAFAVAAFMGLRHGEIQGLLWENYGPGEMLISRSIWNGHVTEPKTRKGRAPVPVIRQLAERLEMHRLRCGNSAAGPIFANSKGKPLSLIHVVNNVILPTLNRCGHCGKAEAEHAQNGHAYKRNSRLPEWHGWHAARRGLGSNLYRLGVPDMVIQRILRHANVSTTATYYIKTAADDVRSAMAKLESHIAASARVEQDTYGTPNLEKAAPPSAIQ
ncbi:MAG: tyrosine-type recombinase/integrase [Acidobacteria bacterium]|nr:tyrosine-type recombinase/integrase [Acidobacteriota bacterium]